MPDHIILKWLCHFQMKQFTFNHSILIYVFPWVDLNRHLYVPSYRLLVSKEWPNFVFLSPSSFTSYFKHRNKQSELFSSLEIVISLFHYTYIQFLRRSGGGNITCNELVHEIRYNTVVSEKNIEYAKGKFIHDIC